jgi:hypothetical protein
VWPDPSIEWTLVAWLVLAASGGVVGVAAIAWYPYVVGAVHRKQAVARAQERRP